MLAQVRTITRDGHPYQALMFVCPGCEQPGDDGVLAGGLHMLPVSDPGDGGPSWEWDGNLEAPTLSPSILTNTNIGGVPRICHSYLRGGVFDFLSDCTHQFAGQQVPMKPLYEWAVKS